MEDGIRLDNDWKKFLKILYQLPPGMRSRELESKDHIKWLSRVFHYDEMSMTMIISHLEYHKLIKIKKIAGKKGWSFEIQLTPKGFDVALNNERQEIELKQQKRQENTNFLIMRATIISSITALLLVFFELIRFILPINLNSTILEIIRIFSVVIIVMFIFTLIWIASMILFNLIFNNWKTFKELLIGTPN